MLEMRSLPFGNWSKYNFSGTQPFRGQDEPSNRIEINISIFETKYDFLI